MTSFKPTRSVVIVSAVIVVLLAVIAVLGWKYLQSTNSTANDNQKTAVRIQQKVAKIYLLPTDEEPTVAQIQDKTKLANQQFFADARNGDFLLLYKDKKIALVYREKDDKLINVGPISLADEEKSDGTAAGASTSQP